MLLHKTALNVFLEGFTLNFASAGFTKYVQSDCRPKIWLIYPAGIGPLLEAVYSGKVEVVLYLADECDADVNATSDDGKTTLM
ncbi:hypothetical protein PI124_g19149 [Phytophthora idaei]|nr:hypothetical protein PI125_g18207 [Phytophthora idaei]KAG3138510.1 hypothetical protein PI126_g16882 [Phytophthora idaei]KAG3235830.1 hypothetical protein PI124_g19149 [Phytophthora idaei]